MADQQLTAIDLDNPEFQDIWKLISYTRQSVFMTGKAGTGKSTFLRYIVEHTRKKTVVLAPTGIAAVNAGGVTLHSFFHIPLKPLHPDDPELRPKLLRERLKHTAEQRKLIREVELIIIDEVSMVRADVIDFIDKVLRVYSGRQRDAFGGKQLLFVGDIYQLEPVVTQDARDVLRNLYPNLYFFSARVFREFSLVPIELRKVYRQSDAEFIAMLDRMRGGLVNSADIALLNQSAGRVTQKVSGSVTPKESGCPNDTGNSKGEKSRSDTGDKAYTITLAPKRATVDSINESRLAGLRRKLYTFKGEIKDKFPENSLPAPMELQLKVGAQVVFVRNHPERYWVNGTIGVVHSIDKDEITIKLANGDKHVVQREMWENMSYKFNEETKKIEETVLGTFTQYPLRLAWALTIHKSQGLTFDNVIIDMEGGAFSSGQAYVALSRCRSLAGITLKSPLSGRDFFVNSAVRGFSSMFNNSDALANAMNMARADDTYHKAAAAFDRGEYGEAFDLFVSALYMRNEINNPLATRLIKQKLSRFGTLTAKMDQLRRKLDEDKAKFSRLAKEYIEMGTDCMEEENYLAAIGNFDKALYLVPDMALPLQLKSQAAVAAEDYELAAECFGRLLKLNPQDVNALTGVGEMQIMMASHLRDTEAVAELRYEALNNLLAAEQSAPETMRVHELLRDLYAVLGDEEESLRHAEILKSLRRK